MITIRKHLLAILTLALIMALGFAMSAGAVFAAEEGDADSDQGYTYRVSIYAGQQGSFSTGKVWKQDYHAGESISISTEDLGFKLLDDKYYVRGFRVTGHDNDETTGVQRLQIDNIDTDVAYELAYGIRGAMVSYMVNYVDESGNALRDSDTYYGMPGDKPVVSYRYIEKYEPQAYNLGKTLSEDESQNVFNFIYTKQAEPEAAPAATTDENKNKNKNKNNDNDNDNNNGAAGRTGRTNGGTGAGAPGTAGNPAGTGAPGQDGNDTGITIGDNDTPLAEGPQQYIDLDDEETPLASGKFGSKRLPILIGSCIALLVGIILILLALRRRKKQHRGAGAAA